MKRDLDVIRKMQALLLDALVPVEHQCGPLGAWIVMSSAEAANDCAYFGPGAKKSACGAIPRAVSGRRCQIAVFAACGE